jgi:hypothetical protein
MMGNGYAFIIATSHNACLINKRKPQLNSNKKDLKLEVILPRMPFFTFILRIWIFSIWNVEHRNAQP